MKFPDYPQEGKPVEDTIIQMLNWMRANNVVGIEGGMIQEGPNGKIIRPRRANPVRSSNQIDPPFYPKFTKIDGTWYATVTHGIVIDRETSDADALVYFTCPNRLDGANPAKFAITSGQAVYVKVLTDDTGKIAATEGDPCSIVVLDDGEESIHYDPPVGDETTGTDGEYFYKLATFTIESDTSITIDRFCSGGNIDHYRELPMFVKAGGTADIFKEYDATQGKYLTRGITGGDGITVTQNESDIEVKIADGIWGTYTWLFIDEGEAKESTATLVFEAGILVASSGSSYAVGAQTGAGTEASPYALTYEAYNTDVS